MVAHRTQMRVSESATRSGVKRATRPLAPLCLLGILVALAGCGSGGKETGPLSAQEKQFIRNAERHAKVIKKVDPVISSAVLLGKTQYPSGGGLPTKQMDAVKRKLYQRRRIIKQWYKIDKCPSKRLSDLCDLWYDGLRQQVRWDSRLIKFINRPYSKAGFRTVTDAGHKEIRTLRRSQAQIRQIRRQAAK